MEYAYGLIRTVKYFYDEMNSATLTGAIDVVVVEQPDGNYICSPFHVRFGKYGVLHSREKIVDIEINGFPIDIHMKLGENGEAYFVDNVSDSDTHIPDHLSTSPLPTGQATDQLIREGLMHLKENNEGLKRTDTAFDFKDINLPALRRIESMPSLDTKKKKDNKRSRAKTTENIGDEDEEMKKEKGGEIQEDSGIFYLEEDTTQRETGGPDDEDKTPVVEKKSIDWSKRGRAIRNRVSISDSDISPQSSRDPSPTPVSDSEVERSKNEIKKLSLAMPPDMPEWKWGEMPDATPTQERPPLSATSDPGINLSNTGENGADSDSGGWSLFNWSRKQKVAMDGLYLDDLESVEDPNARARYLNVKRQFNTSDTTEQKVITVDETLTIRPETNEVKEEIKEEIKEEETQPIEEGKEAEQVPKPEDEKPEVLDDQSAMSPQPEENNGATQSPSADGGYASHPSSIAEGRASPWPFEIGDLLEDAALSVCGLEEPVTPDRFSSKQISFEQFRDDPLTFMDNEGLVIRIAGRYYPRNIAIAIMVSFVGFQKPLPQETIDKMLSEYNRKKEEEKKQTRGWFSWRRAASADPPASPDKKDDSRPNTPTQPQTPTITTTPESYDSDAEDGAPSSLRYMRSLRLNSDQIKSLGLKADIKNDAKFSVTTKFQGTTWCVCHIYLYKWTDKIVISDVDGTITKSDVLGHVLPVMGAQWAQAGVADLYTRIKANGYRILYLSSRAIGQSHQTKAYLRWVEQENKLTLPDGPLLLSPTSLLNALHKEVIEKRPEEFKTAALSDIKALFPSNPFYAGFGNRVNDVWAYKAVGIPIDKILTINPKGEVRRADGIGFVSSYKVMAFDVADYIFPPLPKDGNEASPSPQEDYSGFSHWRRHSTITDQQVDDAMLQEYEKKRSAAEAVDANAK